MLHAVWQFVAVVGTTREMHCKKVTRPVDAFHDAFGKLPGVKASAHTLGQVLPEAFAATLVNASVADDGKFARARCEINQHPIAFPRPGHAQPVEFLLRCRHWIGDLRLSANQVCWPAQEAMEKQLAAAVAAQGYKLVRAHPYKPDAKHGFISSQKEGLEVLAKVDPDTPLIVAEAVWQCSHHLLAGLMSHRAPIQTVANWSGQWPGLVGMLNLNGSLTKAGVKYSTLWSEDFTDSFFRAKLRQWLKSGKVTHDLSHVRRLENVKLSGKAAKLGKQLGAELRAACTTV